jgi:hypothetical protein
VDARDFEGRLAHPWVGGTSFFIKIPLTLARESETSASYLDD